MTAPITPDEFGVTSDSRADAVTSLHRIVMLREQKKAIEQELSDLEAAVRLELSYDSMPLVDGEHGIVASISERKAPASIDLVTLAGKPEYTGALVAAAQANVLDVKLTALRSLRGADWSDTLLHFEMPGGIQQTLKIEKAKP